jgi:hypothetical protein
MLSEFESVAADPARKLSGEDPPALFPSCVPTQSKTKLSEIMAFESVFFTRFAVQLRWLRTNTSYTSDVWSGVPRVNSRPPPAVAAPTRDLRR